MKKILLMAAGIAMLCGCAKEPVVQEDPVDPVTRAGIVTITFAGVRYYPGVGTPSLQFCCSATMVGGISMNIHNVYLDPSERGLWIPASVTSILSDSGNCSETVPCFLNTTAFLDLNSIQVNGVPVSGDSFNIVGIPTGYASPGSGPGQDNGNPCPGTCCPQNCALCISSGCTSVYCGCDSIRGIH